MKFGIKACKAAFLKAIRILIYRAAIDAFRKIRLISLLLKIWLYSNILPILSIPIRNKNPTLKHKKTIKTPTYKNNNNENPKTIPWTRRFPHFLTAKLTLVRLICFYIADIVVVLVVVVAFPSVQPIISRFFTRQYVDMTKYHPKILHLAFPVTG